MATNAFSTRQLDEWASNRSTRGRWELYGPHRAEITSVVLKALRRRRDGGSNSRLCLLGAGNLNDIDLRAVLDECTEIALVDIDPEAVAAGIERQLGAGPIDQRIRVISPVDLGGFEADVDGQDCSADPKLDREQALSMSIARRLSAISAQLRDKAGTQPLVGKSECSFLDRLPASSFAVVASTCVVSQLLRQLFVALVEHEEAAYPLARLVLRTHLDLILWLLKDGGEGLLITDFAREGGGDDTPSALAVRSIDDVSAPAYAHLSPSSVAELLVREILCRKVANVSSTTTWRWQLAPQTAQLCYAVSFCSSGRYLESDRHVKLADRLRQFTDRTGIAVHAFGSS